jgi:hypothetical protein
MPDRVRNISANKIGLIDFGTNRMPTPSAQLVMGNLPHINEGIAL